jgi:hypothetical protein
MSTFKKYERIDEGFAYVDDPFRDGDPIWVNKVKINDVSVVQIVGSIDGISDMHTAIVSVHIKNLPGESGEDIAREERFIVHQKDFKIKGDAVKHLVEIQKDTKWL